MVHLEFSLSLEQVDKTQSYYLEIKAPQNSDNTITWYGSKNVDNLATLYNGTAVAGEAGYVAYKSIFILYPIMFKLMELYVDPCMGSIC